MRTMVVGASGFVGRSLLPHLHDRGHEVVAVTRGSMDRKLLPSTVHALRADVRDEQAVDRAIRASRPTAVINLTTSRGPTAEMDAVNHTAAVSLARSCADHGVRRLVHLTSSTQYGPVPGPQQEDGPCRPVTDYGRTKLAGSTAALDVGRSTDLEVVVLVIFQIYGVGQPAATLLAQALTCARTGAELPVTPRGCTRDYVEVTDVVRAVGAAVDTPGLAGQTLNVCSGVATDNHEVVDVVERVVGRSVRRRVGEADPRPWDHGDWRGDPRRAADLLGWTVRLSLEEGIARLASGAVAS